MCTGASPCSRRVAALVLLAIYVALPWIPVNGYPGRLSRRRRSAASTSSASPWPRRICGSAFFLITGLGFSLFYVTSFFGRVWCGWTCPYTVFLEHVYRRIERWIDGDAPARRRLDDAPWTASKIGQARPQARRSSSLVSAAHRPRLPELLRLAAAALRHDARPARASTCFAFGVVLFLTGALYFAFSWFREQFCIILCPYGRLQSALTDDNTVVIGYDRKRGEPRGKAGTAGAGDCINCLRCVQVCPTGIDIRNGLQLECIGCAACVDACDAVMTRLERPPGLVRYDSLNGLGGGRTRYLRGRTIGYSLLAIVGLVVFAVSASSVKPMNVTATRMKGAPFFMADGLIRNQFNVQVINKRNTAARFIVELRGAPAIHLNLAGTPLEVPALGQVSPLAVLTLPQGDFHGPAPLTLVVREDKPGGQAIERKLEFLGPDTRLQNNDYLSPDHYKK